MKDNPLVSVIVPVFKVEKYIHSCVDSIIAQSYDNLEIILVDDGSPDNCGAVCDEYAAQDNRIKVIHKVNGGLSSARNAGLDIMAGDWVCFVDSDDVVAPQFVEQLLRACLETGAEVSSCKYQTVDFHKKLISEEITDFSVSSFDFPESVRYSLYRTEACCRLYCADLMKTARFEECMLHEDLILIPRILYYAKRVALIDSKLYYYLQRSNSIMGKTRLSPHLILAVEMNIRYFRCVCADEKLFGWLCCFFLSAVYHEYVTKRRMHGVKEMRNGAVLFRRLLKKYRNDFLQNPQMNERKLFLMKLSVICFPLWKLLIGFLEHRNGTKMKLKGE